jgi:hypothetical protein
MTQLVKSSLRSLPVTVGPGRETVTVVAYCGENDGQLGDTVDEALGEEAVVLVELDPAKQEHALESLDAEDEHGVAKVGINGAAATVYV